MISFLCRAVIYRPAVCRAQVQPYGVINAASEEVELTGTVNGTVNGFLTDNENFTTNNL